MLGLALFVLIPVTLQVFKKAQADTSDRATAGDPQSAAAEIKDYYIHRYAKKGQAIHLESVLSALGSAAGFGCQMAIREGFVKTGKVPAEKAFVVVKDNAGRTYFFGDLLNQPLLSTQKGQFSVWNIVAGGAQSAGAVNLPDPMDIVKYNAQTLGTKEFGIPRVSKEHQPEELPEESLRATWHDVQSIMVSHHINPLFWGWTPAMAAQKLIIENKDKIDPALAAKIVMESALPMSKIDPEAISVKP